MWWEIFCFLKETVKIGNRAGVTPRKRLVCHGDEPAELLLEGARVRFGVERDVPLRATAFTAGAPCLRDFVSMPGTC